MSGAGVVDQQVDTPRSVRMERMPESTDSSLVTSRLLSSTPGNSSAISRNDSAVSGRRAVAMTRQPAAASARVVASPMPLLAPVTTATEGISLRSPISLRQVACHTLL
jgi:hypothetical protein